MKKIIAINASPRSSGNTAEILRHALQGAASAGADTELVNLADKNFSGCKSCFACKLKNGTSYGKCALQDDMTPVLHEVLSCDGLITGTPVYFGAETGLCRNFIERLFFPLLRYDATHSSLAPKAIPLLFVYTMNVTEELMHKIQYPEHLGIVQKFAGRILRSPSTDVLYVCDTFQFDDYSRYDAPLFDAAAKQKVRDTKFQEDCRKAFIAGSKLVKP